MLTFNLNKKPTQDKEDALQKLFLCYRDRSLIELICNEWHMSITPKYYSLKVLSKRKPEFYDKIVSLELFDEFKSRIRVNYISKMKSLFFEFENPEEEFDFLSNNIEKFENSIKTNSPHLISSELIQYIEEILFQLLQLKKDVKERILNKNKNNSSPKTILTTHVSPQQRTESVFGKDFNFIDELYMELWNAEFFTDNKYKYDFSKYFYPNDYPDKK